jgi:hypothetical protein
MRSTWRHNGREKLMSAGSSEKNAQEKDMGHQRSRVAGKARGVRKGETTAETGPRRLGTATARPGRATETTAETGPRRLGTATARP